MTKLWPKSLFGQLMLLVALALFVAQAINFAMLVRAGERLRFSEGAGPVVARIITAAERIEVGEPLRSQRGRGRDGGPAGGRGMMSVGPESAVRADDLTRVMDYEQRLASGLETAGFSAGAVEVGRADITQMRMPRRFDRRMDHRRPPQVLRVSVQLEDGRWLNSWMRIRPGGIGALVSIIAQTVILYGILMLALFLFVRRVSRPLRSLTGAVREFTDADDAAPVAVEGPRDVAGLIEAFNAMRVRIAGMLGEKDHMLGAIGHDLRTPLAALRIHAENVPDESERTRMIETITDMTETLDDILSLARLGRPNAQSEKLDLTALVDSAIEDFRDVGASVAFEGGERLVVNGRSNLLKRAIRNLIDNAVRYGEMVSVRVRRDGGQALVEIDDKGPGIDAVALETVFEPFARLDESRNREKGGSGLGLALARAIVHEHGGELTLGNLEPKGLRATIWLPVVSD